MRDRDTSNDASPHDGDLAHIPFRRELAVPEAATLVTPSTDLIFDVGMHVGKDTDFYLRKGFDVIAVEANPELVRQGEQRHATDIEAGRLVIEPVAIADREGTISFYINQEKDDWGTTSLEFAERNERLGTENRVTDVPALPFERLLEKHGVPYYLKIDIEGADMLCLSALHHVQQRPRFVSIEMELTGFADGFESIAELWALGYRRFKIVNQSLNKRVECPNPPLEGRYVPARFDAHCSGPFGEESPGRWLSIDQTMKRFTKVMRQQSLFGATGKYYHTPLRHLVKWSRSALGMEPIGWYDLHARFEPLEQAMSSAGTVDQTEASPAVIRRAA